ncbi:hypothetical protein BRADI_1g20045v3 [Brachypodium distachyon]|uniref:KIB1-4 beta-propeller domain-containing protein n=1 Tax=Brachypodium distachyon TaxID=15368 RepID=A0A0Q3GWY2_BRADI|nr:hypothetical protein BRADI_1g20045v3 [Brachypodium distachyon]
MDIISTEYLAAYSKLMFRAIATNRQLPFELPCLLMPDLATWKDYDNQDEWVVNVVPLDMPPFRANMPFLHDKFWVGGKGDWLATINKAGHCSLVNIYTRRVIDLPSMETAKIHRRGPSDMCEMFQMGWTQLKLQKIVVCQVPTEAGAYSDYKLIALFDHTVAYLRGNEHGWRSLRNSFVGVPRNSDAIEHNGIIFVVEADDGSILCWDRANNGDICLPFKIPPPLEEQRPGLWFLARSANEQQLMIIRTYGSPIGGEVNIPYLCRTVCEYAGFGCHIFRRDTSSIRPGISTWSRVHTLSTHSLFIGINYPMNLHIREPQDPDNNVFPFMRRNCVYTSYHEFRVDRHSPEIRRFSMQQEEGQLAPGISLPGPGWFTRKAAMWFKPSLDNIQTWAHI